MILGAAYGVRHRSTLHPVAPVRQRVVRTAGRACTGTSLGLYGDVLAGLARCGRPVPGVAAIGIDTWAVDYGLLDAAGSLVGSPFAYRD